MFEGCILIITAVYVGVVRRTVLLFQLPCYCTNYTSLEHAWRHNNKCRLVLRLYLPHRLFYTCVFVCVCYGWKWWLHDYCFTLNPRLYSLSCYCNWVLMHLQIPSVVYRICTWKRHELPPPIKIWSSVMAICLRNNQRKNTDRYKSNGARSEFWLESRGSWLKQ